MTASRKVSREDGVTLALDEAGPAGAPTVVLLHGGGQTRHSWASAMRALVAAGYRVLNFDARGHGESDWSASAAYTLEDRAGDLKAVIDGASPVALVGASLGGATSLVAAAGGMSVDAMVLVDITPDPEPAGLDRVDSFMRANIGGFANLEEAAEAVSSYNPHRSSSGDASGLGRNLRQREDGRLYWHWDPRILATDRNLHIETVRAASSHLAMQCPFPLLLVRGLRSDIVSDAAVARFQDQFPWAEVADVPGAGHMIAGDRNDAFNAATLGFLARTMPAPKPKLASAASRE